MTAFVILMVIWQGIDWLGEKKILRGLAAVILPLSWPLAASALSVYVPVLAGPVGFACYSFLPMWGTTGDSSWPALFMPPIAVLYFANVKGTGVEPVAFYKWTAFCYTPWMILPVVLGMLCTMLMYNENQYDMLKQLWIVLVNPMAYLFSKFAVVLVYSVCFMLMTAAASILTGVLPGYIVLDSEDGISHHSCFQSLRLLRCKYVSGFNRRWNSDGLCGFVMVHFERIEPQDEINAIYLDDVKRKSRPTSSLLPHSCNPAAALTKSRLPLSL